MSITIDLAGRVAFVTGSTRGIGRQIAETLHTAGAKVAVVGRTRATAESVASAIGDNAAGFACEMTDAESVRAAIAECEKTLGPVDILVNNAGVTRDNLLVRMSEQDWSEVLAANLTGAFVATQAVIKGMMKRRSGRIVNMTSVVGITGNKGQANYAASKAGLIAFTQTVAQEYAGRGILANCIAPGFIETDMTAALPEATRAALLEAIPLGRLGTPADVAGMVLFLASDLGNYVTGQTFVVDGGMTR
ncbi:MAG TPA: 3-oxoacyl-[acyl-carrier-protein] reductase [Gemmatimonadales bacterium]|nr:3-oxoacyl-[acyl-carrier-protein] reductase [Gemmatimonadales bacterium]